MQLCTADLTITAMIMPEGVHRSLLVGLASPARCMHEPDVMSEFECTKEVDWQTHTTMMHTRSSNGNRVLQLK